MWRGKLFQMKFLGAAIDSVKFSSKSELSSRFFGPSSKCDRNVPTFPKCGTFRSHFDEERGPFPGTWPPLKQPLVAGVDLGPGPLCSGEDFSKRTAAFDRFDRSIDRSIDPTDSINLVFEKVFHATRLQKNWFQKIFRASCGLNKYLWF